MIVVIVSAMSKTESTKCVTLPIELRNFSIEDLELLCYCGHYVNCHSEGLGGGISICDELDCGCIYCEFDYEGTIAFHYFQEKSDRWLISKLTADCKRQWSMTQSGLPSLKEFCATKVHVEMELKLFGKSNNMEKV